MAIILLLFIIFVLVLSIPKVQTVLGKYVTEYINNDFGTHINIGRLGLQFNGDVELKDIFIEDYKKDTLIAVDELNTSILNYHNLINGTLDFGDIDIINVVFNVKTYKGETDSNLDIFVDKFESDNPRNEKSTFLMSSSDVSMYNGTFRFIDENKETPELLEFSELNINATNFVIAGSEVRARINTLSFRDTRGVYVKNMVTDFEYTLEHMLFNNLIINTNKSNVSGNLRFDYNREDFKFFTDKVRITADFKDSEIYLNDLNMFYDEFGTNQKATINVNLSGTLNDLSANNLRLNASGNSKIYGDINFKNLLSKDDGDFIMDARFDNLSSNYYDLRALLPNILGASIPTIFSKLGNFRITGHSLVTPASINTNIKINTDLGLIVSDIKLNHVDDIDNASYIGNIIFDTFDLGLLLNDAKVKKTSFDLDVDGKGFTLDNLNTKITGEVFTIDYNNYAYENITVSGTLGNQVFNGFLESNDNNFKFKFNGLADLSKEVKAFDFNATVDYANLRALNFVTNDSLSILKCKVVTSIKGSSVNDAFGVLEFENISYTNENDTYSFKDFKIESQFESNKRLLNINSPDIIKGSMRGDFKFSDIGKLVENSVGSIYTNFTPNDIPTDQFVEFDFEIYNKIVEVFYHKLEFGANTTIKGRIETDEKQFKFKFKSPKVKLLEYSADNISVRIDNSNPLFNTYVEIDSLHSKHYGISNFNLINVTQRDTLFIKSEFKGGDKNVDDFNLNMFYTVDNDNKSVVGFKKSEVVFKNNKWAINEKKDQRNKIAFTRNFKNFDIDKLVLSHFEERLELSGEITGDDFKDITLDFKDVNLTSITPRIDSLKLNGLVNGQLEIIQKNGVYLPNSNAVISGLKANNFELGDLNAIITGNQSLTSYTVDVSLENDNLKSFGAFGIVDINNNSIDLEVDFDEFILEPLSPFGGDVITNIRGLISGNTTVSGKLDDPQFDGDLLLDNAGLTIPLLNVDYSFDFDSQVTLESQRFLFKTVEITDSEYFSKATLDGFISHQNFSNWTLGIQIETERLLVLNTAYNEEEPYYGTGFVTGRADIVGPTDNLKIEFNGSTAKGTVFKIPLSDIESYGDNSYIHFLSPQEKEARSRGEFISSTEIKGVELEFNLFVNPYADIEIVIDESTGNAIQGKGNGNLLFDINTNGKFQMFGDFQIVEGTYNFAYGGLVQKKLTVEPNGYIRWEGNPLKAQLGLTAVYKTQANPSVLLDNPINRNIDVEVKINLTGELEQPDPDFFFNFPEVDSSIKSELEYRLETKESREFQALNVLSFGAFASEFNLGQNAYGTISDRVNSIFNSILGSDKDDKIQVDLNYTAGQQTADFQTNDELGLTLSTRISDRILFNGTVGVPIGGVNQTVIAGDVQIDVLLNDDGTLKATFFNRENSIRNFGEEIGYTQGAGISYNVEFDSFKEFVNIIFSGKNKKTIQLEPKEKRVKKTDKMTPSFINLNSKEASKSN